MIDTISRILEDHRDAVYLWLRRLRALDSPLLTAPELAHAYAEFLSTPEGSALAGTEFDGLARQLQEAVVEEGTVSFGVREQVARWRYLAIHSEEMHCRELSVRDYLRSKERLVRATTKVGQYTVEVDLAPFERGFPKLTRARSIGRGVEHLNRYLSARLFTEGGEGRKLMLDFLREHAIDGRPVMLNGVIETVDELRARLREAIALLEGAEDSEEGWDRKLHPLGFAPGWGRTAGRIRDTMERLQEILEAPSPAHLDEFLARIPMITSVAILSPHGYFGQSNVLGKPDTGGQVVYILDQVRALEEVMRHSLHEQGLDVEPKIVVLTRLIPEAEGTTCDQREEPIHGTRNAKILRVPFRTEAGEVVRPWISRFMIWPYLERYALEAERDLLAELGGRPDFIVGNYSDGNLVASVMAHRLGVTQCTIAHALEKTKYPGSDLFWEEQEDEYHFSCQYTADLIAMNRADFIITSTYQEIAGTEETAGQYESHQAFTLPGLYRVVSGIDCFDPKFNIVSPGASAEVFFPYTEEHRRPSELREEIRELVFGDPADSAYRGAFDEPDKPILFAMSRLDRIKNMSGLLEVYLGSPELQSAANLLLVGGQLDREASFDQDERKQIDRMHELLDEAGLDGKIRWVVMQTDKNRVGEIYRLVADTRGAFVQPALFEAFGLTVVESMSTGLPTFVTKYGGPSEIVEDGLSGFHIDPGLPERMQEVMVRFLTEAGEDRGAWDRISAAAIRRVEERYNWSLYASTLLKLSRIYGFWRYISSLEREETDRYLEMFYGLMFRPLAKAVPTEDP